MLNIVKSRFLSGKKAILLLGFFIIVHFTLYIEDCFSQWVQCNGPYGGEIRSFCSNDSYVFAGTMDAGVYRSTDNGSTWIPTNLNSIYVYCLASNGSNIFAGTWGKIYRSTNNGLSWTYSQVGNYVGVYALVISGSNIFAGSYHSSFRPGGVWLSTDNGSSWTRTSLNKTVYSLAASGNYIFAGTSGSGVYFSTDNGSNWIQTSLGNRQVNSLAVNGNGIYAGTAGVYFSSNNGASWIHIGLNNLHVRSLTINGNYLYAGTDTSGVYFTINNGTNWIQTSLNNRTVFSLLANSSCIFAGTGGQGIYNSTDNGANWLSTGVHGKIISSFTAGNEYIFAGTNYGIYRSMNSGGIWEFVLQPFSESTLLDWNNSNIYVATNLYDQEPTCSINHSTNNGANWIYDYSSLGTIKSFATSGSNIFCGFESFYMRGDVLLYSTNYGIIWNYLYLGLDIRSLAINGSYIFAGTVGNGVYLSTNNGTNWTQTSLNNQSIYSLLWNDLYLYAGTGGNGVFQSSDNGINWTQTLLTDQTVWSLAVNGNNIIAGTNNGVYVNGIQKNEGFTGIPRINALLIINGYVFAGTNGQSLWRRPLSDVITGIQPVIGTVPEKYELGQNYPNPFNAVTSIKFQVASVGQSSQTVTLILFDLLGKEVATLVNEKLQPGTYEVTFNAGYLPSGIYFYRLTTGDFTDTKRMILIK